MATSLSIYKGSDETYLQDCDVCTFQNVTSEAVSFCTICKEYLCTVCQNVHRSSKLTRNHTLLTGSNLASASTMTKPTSSIMFCEHHKTIIVDMYCKSHDVVICGACKITSHKKCKITDLSQETKQMQKDGSFNKIKTQLEDLNSQYQNMKSMRQQNKSRFKSPIEKCREDMRQIRQEINETLDSIENTLSKEIQHADERITKDIAGHIAIFDDILSQVMEQLINLKESEKAQDDQVMFVEIKRASIARQTYAETLSKLEEEINKPESQFKINDTLCDTVRQLQSIETVLLDRQGIRAGLAYGLQCQKSLLNMSISGRRDMDIGDTNVFGCTFIPDGHLVLCCGKNGPKLLDKDFNIKSQLNTCALHVAAVNDNEIIVTQESKQILKVTIFPQMEVSKIIKMDRYCFGVDVFGDEIYVTCRDIYGGNCEVKVLNMYGKVQRILGLNNGKYTFSWPDKVTVNNDGSKVFVSDWDTNIITCLDTHGYVLYRYSNLDLTHSKGMYVDCEGNLLVCGSYSNNVLVIGQDGRTEKILLSEADGVVSPSCIALRQSDGCLVVGKDDYKNKSLISYTAK